jgi:hypothetical protein
MSCVFNASMATRSRRYTFFRSLFKPYWGKPVVQNFRGGDGNVGIIRSPVHAIALPDR